MSDYKSETQIRCEKIKNRLLKDLPPFCTTFFIGKEARLSAQTAVSYAYEYHYFFSYLCKYNSYFKNKGMRNITIEDIGLLKTEDIEEYLHWLRFHEKEILNDEDAVAYRDNTNNIKRQVCRNKESSISKYLSALSSLYTYFIKRGHLSFNPTAAIDREKKTIKKPIVLDKKEKEKLFNSISYGAGLTSKQICFHEKNSKRDLAIFQILLDTGIRVSELVGLDITDINFEEHYFTVFRKGGKQEDIYFSDVTQQILKDYLLERPLYHPQDDDKALFLSGMGSTKGKRLSERSVQLLTKKYISSCAPERAKIISPHKMRSTFGTDMLNVTGDIELVSELLGHSSLNTTKIYSQYSNSKKKNVRNYLSPPKDN